MAPNAFIGTTSAPTDADLQKALGAAKPVWDRLIAALAEQDVAAQEWKCYSPKSGWALRLLRGKRTIVWMAPCADCFRVAFILGDRAVAAARKTSLPAQILEAIEEAPKYPEGWGVRLHIRRSADLPAVQQLAAIKLAY